MQRPIRRRRIGNRHVVGNHIRPKHHIQRHVGRHKEDDRQFDRQVVASRSGGGDETDQKVKRPWFILGFLAAAALVTWVPALKPAGHLVFQGAQRSLVVTLFLIGGGLSRAALATVGQRPLVQGFLLWILMASGTLGAIVIGWIG